MRIIPVIDLLQGQVVHAVAGQRERYQPIQSRICDSAQPRDVAIAFSQLGYDSTYVADLDALQGAAVDEQSIQAIAEHSSSLLWDRGIRNEADARAAVNLAERFPAIDGIVLALECIESLDVLSRVFAKIGPQRSIFSLDLLDGKVLSTHWNESPLDIVSQIVDLGIRRMIVLDLARVGTGKGLAVANVCSEIHRRFPRLELISGGGIRNQSDIKELADCGVMGALVATALHNGVQFEAS